MKVWRREVSEPDAGDATRAEHAPAASGEAEYELVWPPPPGPYTIGLPVKSITDGGIDHLVPVVVAPPAHPATEIDPPRERPATRPAPLRPGIRLRVPRLRAILIAALATVVIAQALLIWRLSRGTPGAAPTLPDPATEARQPAAAAVTAQPAATTGAERVSTGAIDVRSSPPGARVQIDGADVGVAPLRVEGLTAGSHVVALTHRGRSVRQNIRLAAGETAVVMAPVAASPAVGWLQVVSPVEVQLRQGTTVIGTSASQRILMPTGRHDLEFVNDSLGFVTRQTVNVSEAEGHIVRLAVPDGRVSINAVPWASVSANGRQLGQTPLGNVVLPIGVHELVFSHPEFGERLRSVTVTTRDVARVAVDFTQP